MIGHLDTPTPALFAAPPIDEGGSQVDVDGRSRGRVGPSLSVLVVDDEPDIVEEVVETLEDEGYDCLSAHDARSALDLLHSRGDIGIVVSDIRMPGMDGLAMAAEIRALAEQGRDISVIMVTGHAGMAEAISALKTGVDDFLTKPISPDHLIHAVQRSRELVRLRWQDQAFKTALELEVAERTLEVRELMAELEAKNELLSVANRAKDEFLDMISHEMNTPLNAILGFGQLLRDDAVAAADSSLLESVTEILNAGNRLHRNLQAILSMASVQRADQQLYREALLADEILTVIVDGTKQAADKRAVAVEASVIDGPIEMQVDIGRLSQAVKYLVDNAVRHSPQGAAVRLTASREDNDMVALRVSDVGPGMTPEQLAAALEPLRRGNDVREDGVGGVGLGLPLARLYAELHGGTMTVDTQPGRGTTVTLSVPCSG